ncbi:MAG: ABC transporter substrate-binding protein [Bacteroidales bacterium]|nr:ABC transporter substrate-binding protein [Bacteroidales bacterium]
MVKTYIITIILIFFALLSCKQKTPVQGGRRITDMLNRTVEIPDSINGIIGICAGTLRLLAYMDAIHLLKGVEEVETRSYKPYNLAYPEIALLPIIGPMHGGDAELIVTQKPDVIFSTYISVNEASELQKKTGIPVIALEYGDLGKNKTALYNSLVLIGEITGKKQRADSLIAFFEHVINDLHTRTNPAAQKDKPVVYIGGVSSRGAHGITSTDNAYEPFAFIYAKNVAKSIKGNNHSVNVDIEQLIKWGPDIVFLDCAGIEIINQEILENPEIFHSMKSFRDSLVYMVQPHNWYTTNFGTVLVNSYFIGKTIYPKEFSDIVLEEIGDSVYHYLLGRNILKEMSNYYGGYSKYKGY